MQPVADLIRAADPRMQRWGIELLAKRGDGPAVELLREALQAPDRDTQIAASGALQRVEERLARRIGQAQEQWRLDPDSPERAMAVGDACLAYQESGLPDAAMGRHWLGEAEAAYRAAREGRPGGAARAGGGGPPGGGGAGAAARAAGGARPGGAAPAGALARVLMAQGQLEEAEALAVSARAAALSADVDLLLSEILFRQGRWPELRALCREAVAAGRGDETLRWWAGEPAA